jgi:transcription elongation factor Elf1
MTPAMRRPINSLPVVLEPLPDELLSSWLARHATFYEVGNRRLLSHLGLEAPCVEALDSGPSLAQQIALADCFRCEPARIAAMTHAEACNDVRRLIRRAPPAQRCPTCTGPDVTSNTVPVLKSWVQGWRITCRACGTRLKDIASEDHPGEVDKYNDLFSTLWERACEGEAAFEEHEADAGDAPSPAVLMRLLLLPRWPEPGELSEGYRPSRLLNAVVPGFDEAVHRYGLERHMVRQPFLPILLRIALLAGLATVMRDPVRMVTDLRRQTRLGGRQRFEALESGKGRGHRFPVSRWQLT